MPIYRSALINRRPGLTDAEFRDHWIHTHGALASKLPGVGTYRQNHIVERFYEAPDMPVQSIDGISQLAFESIAAMEVSDASPQYALTKADIPLFQNGITILVLESEEMQAAPPDTRLGAKLLWLSMPRDDVPPDNLREQWLQAQRASGLSVPGARRFVQNFLVDRNHPVHAGVAAGDPGPLETVSELWFEDEASMRTALASDAGRRLIYRDSLLVPIVVYGIEEVHII